MIETIPLENIYCITLHKMKVNNKKIQKSRIEKFKKCLNGIDVFELPSRNKSFIIEE